MPLILILVGIIYIAETLSDIIQVTYFKLSHGKRIFKMGSAPSPFRKMRLERSENRIRICLCDHRVLPAGVSGGYEPLLIHKEGLWENHGCRT